MHPIIVKTFGGLSKAYYFRQFVFGLIFPALFILILPNINFSVIAVLLVNTLLYPYSRFVYESIIDFIIGNNTFVINAAVMLFVKLSTMALCWALAIFVAPLGLAYLYYHHSKDQQQEQYPQQHQDISNEP